MTVKDLIRRPNAATRRVALLRQRLQFNGSATYWERRYANGGTSGQGSYGAVAYAKADFLNDFVRLNGISSVIEFGCGDGHQLSLADYPEYIGLDVSKTAIGLCKRQFANDSTKSFFLYDGACFVDRSRLFTADLSISLDVIFHLIEETVFDTYMTNLFAAARRYVILYATNEAIYDAAPHVRHRRFSSWVNSNCPRWQLARVVDGPHTSASLADFFVYERR